MKTIIGVGLLLAFLVLATWWQVYKFYDCRNVGHSMLYCILSIGS
jgi:hypothetical protein